ncbi:hypothetical protein DERP_005958 [Dermatophagoides pteronyssinus]|uniref:Uncharacterized protein n=1 Tax=Dermatophagoides pteronyssinus TaxID=6956 RepID=A0ABQ8JRW6_DERPT|nr:hypothetical protein DERP_005958 [Dermatophagoides pteronyssinus]
MFGVIFLLNVIFSTRDILNNSSTVKLDPVKIFIQIHSNFILCSVATSGKYVAVRFIPFSLRNSIRIP